MSSIEQSSQAAFECLDTVNPCTVCPLQVAAGACRVLAKSREAARLAHEVTELKKRESDAQQFAETCAHDELTQFLLPQAVVAKINRSEELQDRLRTGNWGIVWVDVRGLKWVNDTVSFESGNGLISAASSRLHDAASEAVQHRLVSNTRSRSQKVTKDRRNNTTDTDLYIRSSGGGDEFAVLMLDISPEGLGLVEARLKEVFSTNEAIKQDAQMQVPTIASVATCHALDETLKLSPGEDDLFCMYRDVLKQASENHKASKDTQYNEMRATVLAHDPNFAKPNDDRAIAGRYFSLFCPNFAEGRISLIQGSDNNTAAHNTLTAVNNS